MQKYMVAYENSGTETNIVASGMGPVCACQDVHVPTCITVN
jgi:hypothetical protein